MFITKTVISNALTNLKLQRNHHNKFRIFDNNNSVMTVVIDKSNLKNTSKILCEKMKKSPKTGNLTKHFGKLKRNIDGLAYQVSVRENED
jgi:hypothetical protein